VSSARRGPSRFARGGESRGHAHRRREPTALQAVRAQALDGSRFRPSREERETRRASATGQSSSEQLLLLDLDVLVVPVHSFNLSSSALPVCKLVPAFRSRGSS